MKVNIIKEYKLFAEIVNNHRFSRYCEEDQQENIRILESLKTLLSSYMTREEREKHGLYF